MAAVLRMFSGIQDPCEVCGNKAVALYKGKFLCKDHKESMAISMLKDLLARTIQRSIGGRDAS